jgi:predicted patatin/cPLA2 family phospholipase
MVNADAEPVTAHPAEFQVLALDGGGIRGIFSAALLAAVEEDCGTAIVDHFDLLVGTSTGGLVALALGLGKRPGEVVQFYLDYGREIFRSPLGLGALTQWIRPKYASDALRHALTATFGSQTLGDSSKRLVIASYNTGADDVYLFRTPHAARLQRDKKVEAWKVALATSAAPTYFNACRAVDGLRLVDGGLWADNPCMVALTESLGTLGIPLSATSMLSIGTCDPVEGRPAWLDGAGRVGWLQHFAGTVLAAQRKAAVNQARFFLGDARFMRVNPKVPADEVALDRVSRVADFVALARHHSRTVMPEIRKRFLRHRAMPFVPCAAEAIK